MKEPITAKLLLHRNKEYLIKKIHYSTKQVTLKEDKKVYNTVSINDVQFNYAGISDNEIVLFLNAFK